MKKISPNIYLIFIACFLLLSFSIFFNIDLSNYSSNETDVISNTQDTDNIVKNETNVDIELVSEMYEKTTNVYKGGLQELIKSLNESGGTFSQYRLSQQNIDMMITPILYASQNSEVKDAGILIYNQDDEQMVWGLDLSTSSEMFVRYPKELVFGDINNDKKNDILSYWYDSSSNPVILLKLFTFNNDLTISPVLINKQDTLGGAEITLSDIDGDQTQEIKNIEYVWNQVGESQYDIESEVVTSIYKWNGTEYVLWKQQKEPFVNESSDI